MFPDESRPYIATEVRKVSKSFVTIVLWDFITMLVEVTLCFMAFAAAKAAVLGKWYYIHVLFFFKTIFGPDFPS